MRELVGTLVALRRPGRRVEPNALAREHAAYCSAFVQHVFREAGVDLVPGIDVKHTTPEDLARSERRRAAWLRPTPGP